MNQKGFSLIEIAFSIAIITIGLISVISLFTANIKSEIKNRNKLIAVYLANESIEIVRQQRDNNWFAGDLWVTNIPTGDVTVVPDIISSINSGWGVKKVITNDRKKVYLNSDDIYIQRNVGIPGSWRETRFERYLTISENSGGGIVGCFGVANCMEVVSHVSFNGVQLTEITAYFYDGWY